MNALRIFVLLKILETRRLSQDGFKVEHFREGTTHQVGDSAAKHIIRNGWAQTDSCRFTNCCRSKAVPPG
jgi:hypothetical protein